MNLCYPDYDRSILSTLSALTGYFGVQSAYPPLRELAPLLATRPRHVMLLLLDGMGKFPLERALEADSYLRAHALADVTSIFPPTTAAATTSYYCGLSAYESGWLGWHLHMKEYACDVVAFLRNGYYTPVRFDGQLPGARLMPYETVFDRLKGVCRTHAIYAFDSYSEHGADLRHRVATFEDVTCALRSISRSDESSFTIAYWNQPDAAMHRYGMGSPQARAEFHALDRALGQLSGQLRDTLLVITSDHGMIDTTQAVDVARIPDLLEPLVLPPSIEPRCAAFYVKSHRREAFEAAFARECGGDFLLLSRAQVLQSGIFGRGRQHPKFDDYIGDYIGVATGTRYFSFSLPGQQQQDRLIGQHAGLTEAEMLVSVMADRM